MNEKKLIGVFEVNPTRCAYLFKTKTVMHEYFYEILEPINEVSHKIFRSVKFSRGCSSSVCLITTRFKIKHFIYSHRTNFYCEKNVDERRKQRKRCKSRY